MVLYGVLPYVVCAINLLRWTPCPQMYTYIESRVVTKSFHRALRNSENAAVWLCNKFILLATKYDFGSFNFILKTNFLFGQHFEL